MDIEKDCRYKLTLSQEELNNLVEETNSIKSLHEVYPALFELYMELLKHHSSSR